MTDYDQVKFYEKYNALYDIVGVIESKPEEGSTFLVVASVDSQAGNLALAEDFLTLQREVYVQHEAIPACDGFSISGNRFVCAFNSFREGTDAGDEHQAYSEAHLWKSRALRLGWKDDRLLDNDDFMDWWKHNHEQGRPK